MEPIKSLAVGSRVYELSTKCEGEVVWINKKRRQVSIKFSHGLCAGGYSMPTFDELKNKRMWLKIE